MGCNHDVWDFSYYLIQINVIARNLS
jgi:hypothetical protein